MMVGRALWHPAELQSLYVTRHRDLRVDGGRTHRTASPAVPSSRCPLRHLGAFHPLPIFSPVRM